MVTLHFERFALSKTKDQGEYDTMTINPMDVLTKLAGFKDREQQELFLFQHPLLFSYRVQENLSKNVSNMPKQLRLKLEQILQNVMQFQTLLESRLDNYCLGFGPIENIAAKLENGEIKVDYAMELASKPDVSQNLSPLYVKVISYSLTNLVMQGKLRQAIQIHQILDIAVQESVEKQEMQKLMDWEWMDTATRILCEVPDGRVFRSALAAGQRLLEVTKKSEDSNFKGATMHRLGVLHLDPYTANRTDLNYDLEMRGWYERLFDEFGDEINNLPKKEWEMLSPQDALKKGTYYLRQAMKFRSGTEKAISTKALIQALEWCEFLKLGNFQREYIKLSHEALKLLDPVQNPQQWVSVLATLLRHDEVVDTKDLDKIFATSLDTYVQRLEGVLAVDLVLQALAVFQKVNPKRGLELIIQARPLFKHYGNEKSRTRLWNMEVELLIKEVTFLIPTKLSESGLIKDAELIKEQAIREAWDLDKLSTSYIALAAYSHKWNEEVTALELLNYPVQITPILADNHSDMLTFLKGGLFVGVASNAVASSSYDTAVKAYNAAIREYLQLNLPETLMDCLRRINDLATRGGKEVSIEVVLGLAPLVQSLETTIGDAATDMIQNLCKHTIRTMATSAINPEAFFVLLQIAKGMRFATALYAGSRYRWDKDKKALSLLQQIEQIKADLPPNSPAIKPANPEVLLDEATLVASYVRRSDRYSGDSVEDRLVNLQSSFDFNLNKHLLDGARDHETFFMTTQDVQGALDERTVLINYYLGASPDGLSSIYILLITREEINITSINHNFPDSLLELGDEGRMILTSPFALTIEEFRRNILLNPEPMLVSTEAADILEEDIRGYFGYFWEELEKLNSAGKDHLCVVPHGPLHYFPFHLIGKSEIPLADSWVVSYLPNLNLLVSKRGRAAVRKYRRHHLTAVGLSFKESVWAGISPLKESVAEAEAVAEIFDTKPVLENDANEGAVLDALQNSHYVHLSTHGRHNVEAPAFHCLYFTPDAQNDGVVYAYEILSLDLRGLDLVSLSACETGLGRFDNSDNIRGIPASLLLSGVSTVICTLWKVEENVSKYFFPILYSELKAEKSKLDSFATAQRETRKQFPQYRDWGSFYLIGDWY